LTILAGTIPPLWYKLSTPMLIQWDEQWATPEERVLADRANAESGIPALVARAAVSSSQRSCDLNCGVSGVDNLV